MTAAVEPVALQQVTGDTGFVAATVAVAGGAGEIHVELEVRNLTDGEIEVTNPYSGTTYHVISPSGAPVQVAAPPDQAKVHVRRDPAARLAYLGLGTTTWAGTEIPAEELIAERELTLGAGGRATLPLTIAAAIDPADRSVLDAVPAGDYGLVVQLRLVCVADGAAHTALLRTSADIPVTVE